MPIGDAVARNHYVVDEDPSARHRSQTGHRFDQFRLTVSFDTGDAEYLARVHAEAHVIDDANAA